MTAIKLNDELAKLLGERGDVEEMVNSIVHTYLHNGFFRKADVAGVVVARGFWKKIAVGRDLFDAMTHEFQGVAVIGEKESESLFVLSSKLVRLLEENQVVVVLKSPRDKGISTQKEDGIFIPLPRAEMS